MHFEPAANDSLTNSSEDAPAGFRANGSRPPLSLLTTAQLAANILHGTLCCAPNASGPETVLPGRISAGLKSGEPQHRPSKAGRKADFEAFRTRVRPKSGQTDRSPAPGALLRNIGCNVLVWTTPSNLSSNTVRAFGTCEGSRAFNFEWLCTGTGDHTGRRQVQTCVIPVCAK